MSYILDALRKSEQERQRGTPPGLEAIHAPVRIRPDGKTLWPWMLAVALLANAGLLMWWLEPWKGKMAAPETVLSQTTAGRSSDRAAPTAEASAPDPAKKGPLLARKQHPPAGEAQSTPPSQAAEPARGTELSKSGVTANRKLEDRPAGQTGRQGSASSSSPAAKSGQTRSPELTKPEVAPPGGSPTSQPAQASKNSEASRPEEPKRTTSKPTPAAVPVTPPPSRPALPTGQGGPRESGLLEDLQPLITETRPARKEPDYRQVPPSVKGDIPKISLSFLVYSEKPADRRVTINGKVLREGDEVSQGLKLESITHEGAVLSYRGFRFHKGVF